MPSPYPTFRKLLRCLLTLCSAGSALAQEAPSELEPIPPAASEPPQPAAAHAPTPATQDVDLDEIEAALARDADGTEASLPASERTLDSAPGGAAANMNPDISIVFDTALAYFSDDDPLQTGAHDPTETGFNLQQLELAAGAAVDPYLRLDVAIVLSQFGVEVEEAYGTTLALPARFQARFGQFLHRFGRINSTHLHSWDFVDQPFAIGRVFGGEGGRGLGAEVSWLAPLPWYVELVGSALQADGEETARSFYGAEDVEVESPRDLLWVGAIKQFFPFGPDWSLLFGLSSALGPNGSGRDNRTDVYGSDLFMKYRPVTRESQLMISWQTEVFYRRRQVPRELLQDVSLYTQVVVQPATRWSFAARYEFGSPARGLDGDVLNDEGVSLDALDPEWTRNRHRGTVNVGFRPTEFSLFRLQGSYDRPTWLDEGIWAAFLAAELVAGAHGAHTF